MSASPTASPHVAPQPTNASAPPRNQAANPTANNEETAPTWSWAEHSRPAHSSNAARTTGLKVDKYA